MTKKRRKFIVVTLCGVLTLGVITAAVLWLLWWNNPARTLANSLRNTATQDMLKFDIEVKVPKAQSDSSNIVLAGAMKYRSGSGLSADISSRMPSEYGEVSVKSSWVVAPDDSIYVNRVSSELRHDNAGVQSMAKDSTSIDVLYDMVNRLPSSWIKLNISMDSIGILYGIDPCFLSATYATLSQQKTLADSLGELSAIRGLSVKRNGSTYTVQMDPESRDNVNAVYEKSSLYKSLVKCSKDTFDIAKGGLGDSLVDSRIDFDVDDTNNIVKKVTFTQKNGLTTTVKISTASNVEIKAPQVAPPEPLKPGETPQQYLQRVQPQTYDLLMSSR